MMPFEFHLKTLYEHECCCHGSEYAAMIGPSWLP
jgi:hypothetical protein